MVAPLPFKVFAVDGRSQDEGLIMERSSKSKQQPQLYHGKFCPLGNGAVKGAGSTTEEEVDVSMKPGEASKMWVKQYIQIEGQQERQNGYRAPAAARINVSFREGARLERSRSQYARVC